jgi:hypothetical protein
MNSDILSKYSQPPYVIIDLNLKNELFNRDGIQAIFMNIKDCEDFIVKQTNNEKIIVVISGYLLSDELNTLQNYSNIDAIYLINSNEELKPIYTKTRSRK